MMEAKKINEFNKLVFNNGTKENKDLLLENNPEIKELLENSPFDKIIDEDNRAVSYTHLTLPTILLV